MVKKDTDNVTDVAPDSADTASAPPPDFETALAQLEGLVARMESGTLPLDESLAVYEKGVELARICQRRLDHAEQQVKLLHDNLLRPLDNDPDGTNQ